MNSIKWIVLLCIIFTSCKKDTVEPTSKTSNYSNGLLVLNEGLFHQNNSTLSWVNLSTDEVENNVFQAVNNRPLGDTGNDMVCYGNKIYIVVNGSSTIEIIDSKTLKSIKQIKMNYGGQPQQPRKITATKGKVIISSFDGYISLIDTLSLSITKRIKVGRNPEGVCVFDGSVYVSNSGGLDAPNYDTTVFEIDMATYSVVDTFNVGNNPGELIADTHGNVYVVKRGDYSNESSELIKIDGTNQMVTNLGVPATTLSLKDNKLYISYYDYESSQSKIGVYDCNSQSLITPNLLSSQSITTLYGVFPYNNSIICIDAMNFTNSGYLRVVNASGQLMKNYNVGLNPTEIIYLP